MSCINKKKRKKRNYLSVKLQTDLISNQGFLRSGNDKFELCTQAIRKFSRRL